MQTTKNIDFQCPACGFQTSATVTAIVDPAVNPEQKNRLLAGQLNTIQCPNCGTNSTASTPLLYHDASKELLITFVPMQLNMTDQESDKFIGTLMSELTKSMDSEGAKGYIFQPRQALTMQGLIEQVLEADGVTREMMDEQKDRSRLVQTFLQADADSYADLVAEHDDKLDAQFFQTMSIVAQRYMEEGRQHLAEEVLNAQQQIAELSTVGQELIQQTQAQEEMVKDVALKLQALGEQPAPADVIALLKPYAEDDDRLQAFVGLARPLFEYSFFQELTTEIGKAPADERPKLERMRDKLSEYTQLIDQQSQMQMQAAANVLRQILGSGDPEAAVRQNLQSIDDTFMSVLEMNIQAAEQQQDLEAAARLKAVREQVLSVLQESMTPEMRFINDLLSAESQSAAQAIVDERASEFGDELLQTFDAVADVMASQGQTQIVERLQLLRGMTEKSLTS